VTPRRVVIEEPVSLSLGRYLDDPVGLREVLEAIDGLAGNPWPSASVLWGPAHGRLHVGRYRVIYEIGTDVISVRRIDRISPGALAMAGDGRRELMPK
jgi:mRNA interferase RelE/StbE